LQLEVALLVAKWFKVGIDNSSTILSL
jgi:hypothetical protein